MIDLIKNYNNKSSNIAFMEINKPLSLINTPSLHKTPFLAPIVCINEDYL